MRILLLLFFFVTITTPLWSQSDDLEKISTEDSLSLTQTWKKLLPILLQKSVSDSKAIADTVNCYLCLGEGNLSQNPQMDRSAFIQNGIPVLNKYKKIRNSMENDKPGFGIFYYENQDFSVFPVWIVTFHYLKKDEAAKGHEGATIFFEFKKSEEGFKLFQVSTVP